MADIKEVVTVAVEPVNKLIDAVSGAIGKAYEPRHIRKMADADAYRIKVLAEEIRNNSDLPIVFNGTETAIDISDYEALLKRTGNRLAYQEVRKQENIESIVDAAYEELDGKMLASDEEVSREWMNRFIDSAGDISSEDMQVIWSKVLAGEIIEPNSFSIRTLECLRNLSTKDAALFARISDYVFSNQMLYGEKKVYNKYGITYNDLLVLDDCGLLNSSGTISITGKVGKDPIMLFDLDEYILFIESNDEKENTFSIPEHPLTRAGSELCRIAQKETDISEYIKDVVEDIKEKAKRFNCKATLHKVISRSGDSIEYQKDETIL